MSTRNWETLARLVAACGFEPDTRLVQAPAADSHMLEDVDRILRLTPEEHLAEVRNVNEFLAVVHRG